MGKAKEKEKDGLDVDAGNSQGVISIEKSQAKLLNDLNVPLQVSIGKLELTAAQLLDLLPGQTFEFEFDPLATLELRLGDEVIATAQFVLVDSALALKIISVNHE